MVATETAPGKIVAKYATLRDIPGYAFRTPDRTCLFVDTAAFSGVVLTNADIPDLVLLGDVNTADAQHLADLLNGGAAAIACTRGGVA